MSSARCIAEPVAERPDLQLGDLWVFHETGTENGKGVDRRWWRRIAELLPDGTMRVEPANEGSGVIDGSWNPHFSSRSDYPLNFKFPFQAGAEWSFASSEGEHYQNGRHRVVAYETITVPAGTFDCFRIEGVSIYNEKNWKVPYSDTRRMTRWYCPRIKYVAKSHIERNSKAYYNYGVKESVLDSELIYFVVRGVSPAQSERLAAIPLPSDLAIVPPAESLPPEVRSFSGKWGGTWDIGADHILVVEQISFPDKARIIYARGPALISGLDKPWFGRVEGKIDHGALEFTMRNGADVVSYQLLPSGELAGKYLRGSAAFNIRMTRLE